MVRLLTKSIAYQVHKEFKNQAANPREPGDVLPLYSTKMPQKLDVRLSKHPSAKLGFSVKFFQDDHGLQRSPGEVLQDSLKMSTDLKVSPVLGGLFLSGFIDLTSPTFPEQLPHSEPETFKA